ncbi:MAG: hypothetical protein AMJ43_08060 [Coxiella sp. DG_40]|nr:MAG: hypothetical protein AMJ43_08060 [Coxiella sp. DG_40]
MSLTLDNILQKSLWLIASFTLIVYYIYGDNFRVDHITMYWFMVNGILCYALLLISKRLNIELLCILVFVILIWYVARIPIMIMLPALAAQPQDRYFWYQY